MVINQGSVEEANKYLDHVVTPLQYRPNFVVKGPKAFEEDNWNWVKIGHEVLLKHVNPCDRYANISTDILKIEINYKYYTTTVT